MADLAGMVTQRRRALGLTQADAAAVSGVSERFVREVESGKQTLRLDKLEQLLDALGVELVVRVRGASQAEPS
ncbi:type II toxin-antitoxin system Y4mF family antitoxin [Nigerium massiliense]|uniref:type II toxin-antitoxin system Y4mF family antitoxin n=1 Tax=Nigerium massiliense TaxID=1522317 RepID=UPI001C451F50|nr:type II toxin-antitoxin system Y4mF family antitoxin [Nigerium massiliense]